MQRRSTKELCLHTSTALERRESRSASLIASSSIPPDPADRQITAIGDMRFSNGSYYFCECGIEFALGPNVLNQIKDTTLVTTNIDVQLFLTKGCSVRDARTNAPLSSI